MIEINHYVKSAFYPSVRENKHFLPNLCASVRNFFSIFSAFSSSLKPEHEKDNPITLFEAKSFLDDELNILLYQNPDQSMLDNLERRHRQLSEYFRITHQREGLLEIEASARQKAFFELLKKPRFIELLAIENGPLHMLCSNLVQDIENKFTHWPSIHGHSRDLIGNKHVFLLNTIIQHLPETHLIHKHALQVQNRISQELFIAASQLEKHRDLFLKLVDCQIIGLNIDTLSEQEMDLVIQAKNALLEIDLSLGRNFERDILIRSPLIPALLQAGIKISIEIDSLRGEKIDKAQLLSWIQEHNKARIHQTVGVEGGGPIGLLLGITQYQAGANVSLFEKRDTLYDRTQIVRLDPKWMDLLRFYLGESYYHLFQDKGHKGIIRSDGFGEIATLYLEDALHIRLTELMSMIDVINKKPPSLGEIPDLERIASHEVIDVLAPSQLGKKFELVAQASSTNETTLPIRREIDLLVAAGGKKSAMKERFLPSAVAVTEEKHYGVCSWLSPSISGQHLDTFDMFADFRGMLHLDAQFFERLQKKLSEWAEQSIYNKGLKDILHQTIHNSQFKQLIRSNFEQAHVQTRTFENDGLIYIGMEIPLEVKKWLFEELESHLKEYEIQFPSLEIRQQKIAVLNTLKHLWFQNVMEAYGHDKTYGLTLDKMDKKFCAIFPLDQYRLDKDHCISELRRGNAGLLFIAAGDAFCNPHFMRYSGLTGGRENVLDLQRYMRIKAQNLGEESDRQALEDLKQRGDLVSEFVISRGTAFLQRKSEKEIAEIRLQKMEEILEKIALHPSQGKWSLQKIGKSRHYLLQYGTKSQRIIPQVGFFESNGKSYESSDQILFELGLPVH